MKPPAGMVLIYGLTAEGEGIRYIGVTKQDSRYRLASHLYEARKGKKTYKCHWLRKCLAEGRIVRLVQIICVNAADWVDWERRLIAHAPNLTNGCAGGRGVLEPSEETRRRMIASNRSRDPEVRAKISAANRRHWMDNPDAVAAASAAMSLRMTTERRQQVSAQHKGKTLSEETSAKLSEAGARQFSMLEARFAASRRSKGYKHTEEAKAKIAATGRGRRAHTPEGRARISAAMKARRAAEKEARRVRG